jgi:hypothetical protein
VCFFSHFGSVGVLLGIRVSFAFVHGSVFVILVFRWSCVGFDVLVVVVPGPSESTKAGVPPALRSSHPIVTAFVHNGNREH